MPEFLAAGRRRSGQDRCQGIQEAGPGHPLNAKVSKTEITGKGKKKEVVVTYTDAKAKRP
jgi:dihydrolipoamide dehydrogenase